MEERDDKPQDGALIIEERAARKSDDDRDDAADEKKAALAVEMLQGILDRMQLETSVAVRTDEERIVLDVAGPDAGRAIGKKGTTLDALQFLVNKIVNRFPEGRRHVIVDSGDYRDRHDRNLVSRARREAKRAVQEGMVITLEPMSARDRRVIHLSLAKFEGVSTQSQGEGTRRRIQIIPSRPGPARQTRRRGPRPGGPY